jgi:hypothetical protein
LSASSSAPWIPASTSQPRRDTPRAPTATTPWDPVVVPVLLPC